MKSEKGASIVEFALVLPILILLVFGIIDFGRIFYAYLTIDHAGREAARFASINPEKDDTDIIKIAVDKSGNLITNENVEVQIPDTSRGANATVIIEYDVEFLTPIISSIFDDGITLSDTTIMRIE